MITELVQMFLDVSPGQTDPKGNLLLYASGSEGLHRESNSAHGPANKQSLSYLRIYIFVVLTVFLIWMIKQPYFIVIGGE